jgi:methylthioribose-1-phosphate isomerase
LQEYPIEERLFEEVTGYRGYQWALKSVKERNPALGVTRFE